MVPPPAHRPTSVFSSGCSIPTTISGRPTSALKQILGDDLHCATAAFDKRPLECLNTALVVSYWRPFSNNRGAIDVDPALPGRYRRCFRLAERALHERIGRARKEDQLIPTQGGRSIRITVSELNGVTVVTPTGRDPFVPLHRHEIKRLDAMISMLLTTILEDQTRIVRTLKVGESF